MTYYNEFDPFAAAWLEKLIDAGHISGGTVDRRSITDVKAEEVKAERVHLFAGIGGWDYALQLAGWPPTRPVWTGSCPCQPFSAAGKRKGQADDRHLWPDMFRLIRECRPDTIFGEQVASAIGHGWLDGVFADLESEGYTCGAIVLGAHSIGAPHIRQRLWWVAASGHAKRWWTNDERPAGEVPAEREQEATQPGRCSAVGRVEHAESDRRKQGRPESDGRVIACGREFGGMVYASGKGLDGHTGYGHDGHEPRRLDTVAAGSVATASVWADSRWHECRDGKARRIPIEPALFPLAHGLPGRVGLLRGAGNAIVPAVAAAFIAAFLEETTENRLI